MVPATIFSAYPNTASFFPTVYTMCEADSFEWGVGTKLATLPVFVALRPRRRAGCGVVGVDRFMRLLLSAVVFSLFFLYVCMRVEEDQCVVFCVHGWVVLFFFLLSHGKKGMWAPNPGAQQLTLVPLVYWLVVCKGGYGLV